MPGPKTSHFIRHAEKPDDTTDGVDEAGTVDKKSLTPDGWERAGALAVLFGRRARLLDAAPPDAIHAASVADPKSSKRPLETVTPLARMLGVAIAQNRDKDDMSGLIDDVLRHDDQIVLVSWEHNALAKGLAADSPLRRATTNSATIPAAWPDERFDVIWTFTRQADGQHYVFSQIPQLVLAGDRDAGI